jgi:hypothetical protein
MGLKKPAEYGSVSNRRAGTLPLTGATSATTPASIKQSASGFKDLKINFAADSRVLFGSCFGQLQSSADRSHRAAAPEAWKTESTTASADNFYRCAGLSGFECVSINGK